MSEGKQAGEEVKGVFKGIGQIGENIRNEINSFADNVVDNKEHKSTGFSQDAKAVGSSIDSSVNSSGSKVGETTNQTQRGQGL